MGKSGNSNGQGEDKNSQESFQRGMLKFKDVEAFQRKFQVRFRWLWRFQRGFQGYSGDFKVVHVI